MLHAAILTKDRKGGKRRKKPTAIRRRKTKLTKNCRTRERANRQRKTAGGASRRSLIRDTGLIVRLADRHLVGHHPVGLHPAGLRPVSHVPSLSHDRPVGPLAVLGPQV